MLTLFTIPKAFDGHINVIQRNAIQSWLKLEPRPEIVVIGDDPGADDICREFGLIHAPDVERNEFGTPLVNDVFAQGEKAASNEFVCYINTDIILLNEFMKVIETFSRNPHPFLLIGRRWDLELKHEWDFSDPEWDRKFREYAEKNGEPHHIGGMDFFAYKKGFYKEIPPLALGRCVWDNWLVWAGRMGGSLVDITNVAWVFHQDHDYSHVQYTTELIGRPGIDAGPERKRNLELAGWPLPYFDLRHATHRLNKKPTQS